MGTVLPVTWPLGGNHSQPTHIITRIITWLTSWCHSSQKPRSSQAQCIPKNIFGKICSKEAWDTRWQWLAGLLRLENVADAAFHFTIPLWQIQKHIYTSQESNLPYIGVKNTPCPTSSPPCAKTYNSSSHQAISKFAFGSHTYLSTFSSSTYSGSRSPSPNTIYSILRQGTSHLRSGSRQELAPSSPFHWLVHKHITLSGKLFRYFAKIMG